MMTALLLALSLQGGPADSLRLRGILDTAWQRLMVEFPEWATQSGYPGQNRRWTDYSLAAFERRRRTWADIQRQLGAIRRTQLNETDRLSYDVASDYFTMLQSQPARDHSTGGYGYTPLTQVDGAHIDLAQIVGQMPARTVADYEDIIARLRAIPALVDGLVATLGADLQAGITLPKIVLRDVPDQIRAIANGDSTSPLLEPFGRVPSELPAAERDRLRRAGAAAVREAAAPALQRLLEFMERRYIPAARTSIALTALPDGAAWYARQIRKHTTTNLAAAEIHRIGLAEVRRLRAEMDSLMKSAGFQGTLAQFAEFLRTDPRFFFTDAASLVRAYRDIAKRADPGLVQLFGRLPRLPYGVTPVPSFFEKSTTTAYYQIGSPQAGRAGVFFVNTYDLKSRPTWEMEALTMHEAVPGHHLQIALGQELEGVPELRRQLGYNAFVEGWALYAETLGGELGFYTDPYSRFGQASYQMWRAIRLVLDTGIHAMGWTREQAIAYFKENSTKPEHDIVVEVDRYIAWPGQALGYMLGALKIRELRDRARQVLGQRFDVRAFHDAVLGQGALPLDLLEQRLDAWIRTQTAALDWSADDSARVLAITSNPTRLARGRVVVWAPRDSLDARWLDAFADSLASGVADVARRIGGVLPWQRLGSGAVEFYLSPGRFVSHASGEGAVFISLARARAGGPFLHEAAHELLAPHPPFAPWEYRDSLEGERALTQFPVWLNEGLADYLAQAAAAATGFHEGDVFEIGGLAKVDSVCAARLAASPRRAEILAKVGGPGRLEALFTAERPQVAPVFYACSQSFTKHLVGRIGLPGVIALFPAIAAGTWLRDLEVAAGTPLEGERRRWLARIGAPAP